MNCYFISHIYKPQESATNRYILRTFFINSEESTKYLARSVTTSRTPKVVIKVKSNDMISVSTV